MPGIDALSGELTFARFRELLKGRTGMIKPGLMNQSIIAGIGNIYSDEILFQAEVHPETKIDKLGADKIEAVYRAMRKVLKAAVFATDTNKTDFTTKSTKEHEGRNLMVGTGPDLYFLNLRLFL